MNQNMSIHKYIVASLFCLIVGFVQAQDHRITKEEALQMPEYLKEIKSKRTTSPPPFTVRTLAEWEPVSGLIISWTNQTAIQREIVRNAVNECKVYILTNNSASVENVLVNADISLDSVVFVNTAFNTIWVRDYGPWSVYDEDVDSLRIIDWIYNRPRPSDDGVPGRLAEILELPFHEAVSPPYDWVHTGGNHLTDGLGTAFSSLLVMNENPDKDEVEIDSIAKRFLGVNRYIKFPTLPYDGIHHLDMHMCVLDEETIMFGQYPEGVADGPQIEENIQYLLENFTAPSGKPYRIVRIPMPPDGSGRYPNQNGDYRTYTNSIFINKTILVPVYQEQYDTTALRIYRENLPGYNVVGINCNNIIPQLGALHCITKTVGKHSPLWIAHSRLRDQEEFVEEYPVSVTADHFSGVTSVDLYYRKEGDATFEKSAMTFVSGQTWEGIIPKFEPGTEVEYYFEGFAMNGQSQTRPITGSEGGFKFNVLGEILINLPPSIGLTSPSENEVFSVTETVEITYEASDIDGVVDSVFLVINEMIVDKKDDPTISFTFATSVAGAYSIKLIAIDDDGAQNESELVNILVEDLSGTNWANSNEIKIYPNPVKDFLEIQSEEDIEIIKIVDVRGKAVSYDQSGSSNTISINVEQLASGVYVLKGIVKGEEGYFRFLKM